MSREDVVRFCHARQRLRDTLRDTKNERQELYDAQRTVGGLLLESMTRNGVQCVAMPDNRFVRVVNQKARALRIKTVDEGLDLLSGLDAQLQGVLRENIPGEAVKFTKQRICTLSDGDDSVEVRKRLQITSKQPKSYDPAMLPGEVTRLTKDYTDACSQRLDSTQTLRPLRESQRDTERALLQTMSQPVSVQQRTPDGRAVIMEIAVRREGASESRDFKGIGTRAFVKCVEEEAARMLDGPVEQFGLRLRAALRARLQHEKPKAHLKVKVTNAKRSSPRQ